MSHPRPGPSADRTPSPPVLADSRPAASARVVLAGAALLVLLAAGCRQDMHDQPRLEPLEASRFFADGRASREPVAGTVPRGTLGEDRAFHAGMTDDGRLVERLPVEIDRAALERGRDLFHAYCTPCHDRLGSGQGMIVRRGFKQPESYHAARLRSAPVGHFFDVMTHGFGQMSSYAAQLSPGERWAVAAYIRVLQLSQAAPLDLLDADDRRRLEHAAGEPAGAAPPSAAAAPDGGGT